MEIAKGIKSEVFLNLNLTNYSNSDWQTAINILNKRITERYIEPIEVLLKAEVDVQQSDKKFGFAILAIDFMLCETIQSFIEGIRNSKGQSEKIFSRFLEQSASFKPYFPNKFSSSDFYKKFRCGILHQTQTFENTKVWSIGELIFNSEKYTILNRVLFHKLVVEEFSRYIGELLLQNNTILLDNFKLKMHYIATN